MFGDIGKMLQLAGKIKAELPALRQRLAAAEFAADAPTDEAGASISGGAVTATVNGKMQLIGLKIAPELLAGADPAKVADLVLAAVAAAQDQATRAAAEAMKQFTGGVDIPGLEGML